MLATVILAAGGCGTGSGSVESGSVGAESVTSGPVAPGTTATTAEPGPGELTDLARTAAAELADHAAERGSPPPTDEPEDWLVTMEVDLPLTDPQLDAPIEALPAPFDQLVPALESMTVRAEGDQGLVGHRLDAPFAGLRAALDGSTQVVTTVPGDDPPPTATWVIENPRITELQLTVTAFDDVAAGPEIIALVGAERVTLGLPGRWATISLADARAGVTATLPPLTGTRPPPPTDDEKSPRRAQRSGAVVPTHPLELRV